MITELPAGVWTMTYKDWLEHPKQQAWISKVSKDMSTPSNIHFEVCNNLSDEDVEKKFNLTKKVEYYTYGV